LTNLGNKDYYGMRNRFLTRGEVDDMVLSVRQAFEKISQLERDNEDVLEKTVRAVQLKDIPELIRLFQREKEILERDRAKDNDRTMSQAKSSRLLSGSLSGGMGDFYEQDLQATDAWFMPRIQKIDWIIQRIKEIQKVLAIN
jgi:thymidylate synthase